jgi:hypothetical protein
MPAINKPNQHFDVLTWSGTGGSSGATRSITGLNFQPDLIWEKARTSGTNFQVLDSVRGVGQNKSIATNSNGAEPTAAGTESLYGWLSSIDSGGFTLTNGTSTFDNWNKSGDTYVGWTWKAGNGTTSTNSLGNRTSTVSVNTTAGFSIVSWTHSTSGTNSIGHGLPGTPEFIMMRSRDSAYNWDVYHGSIGAAYRLIFTTSAQTTTVWDGAPNGNAFYVTASDYNNGDRVIAYCWTSIPGFSKFGSYTGNGSTDGPFVYCGFRPRFVLVKDTTNITYWLIGDSSRNTYNAVDANLYPNSAFAEAADPMFDFLSNGFKVRKASGNFNNSGAVTIYAAFAEAPFKYANAR